MCCRTSKFKRHPKPHHQGSADRTHFSAAICIDASGHRYPTDFCTIGDINPVFPDGTGTGSARTLPQHIYIAPTDMTLFLLFFPFNISECKWACQSALPARGGITQTAVLKAMLIFCWTNQKVGFRMMDDGEFL